MQHHRCGWQGSSNDLQTLIWSGVAYGFGCPRCGGAWPFDEEEKHTGTPKTRERKVKDAATGT